MRTDAHKPSFVRPEDYTYIGIVYQGPSEEAFCALTDDGRDPEYRVAVKALGSNPFHGNHESRGTCDHCGAHFHYGMVYRHNPSSEHICVGHDCARETFSVNSRQELDLKRLKKRLASERKRLKIKVEAETFLKNHDGLETALKWKHYILADLESKLFQYGSLSDKQIELAFKIHRDFLRSTEEKKDQPIAALVAGKGLRIRGKILSMKYQENHYGYDDILKMLVLDDRGFKIWGSVPNSIGDVERGDYVDFVANVEKSKDDPFFGFFKRPRKAAMLQKAESQ